MYETMKAKISQKNANVSILGMGYVGLPLAYEACKSGFQVSGIDPDLNKINLLKIEKNYIKDVNDDELNRLIQSKRLIPTTDFSVLRESDIVSICVPTPLTPSQQPDISYIKAAVEQLKKYMHKGMLIVLESTTYPGTTEELIEQELYNSMGMKAGEDYFLCFSPERVDPGNQKFNTKNTPKVVGGQTPRCTEIGTLFYSQFIDTVVPVSSPKVAEMSKLLENTFRSVNISFINEMAMLCDKLEVNVWEVIEAAKTKPFGFMPFYPGPGIGGHCIPLDPMYLSWKAKGYNFFSRFIELAQDINKNMPNYVINKLAQALNSVSKPIRGSKILLLGMAYKPDVDDLRESPSMEIYELLRENGAIVDFQDPYAVKFKDSKGTEITSIDLSYEAFKNYECVILLTNHSVYDFQKIEYFANMILDTRNGFKGIYSDKIIRIGDSLKNKVFV